MMVVAVMVVLDVVYGGVRIYSRVLDLCMYLFLNETARCRAQSASALTLEAPEVPITAWD